MWVRVITEKKYTNMQDDESKDGISNSDEDSADSDEEDNENAETSREENQTKQSKITDFMGNQLLNREKEAKKKTARMNHRMKKKHRQITSCPRCLVPKEEENPAKICCVSRVWTTAIPMLST
ncbi:uncharacterized protein LOC117113145 [Anneissia japonica]|uniref:uncharacterized protein LOC117113145 n=1 Tax=Anneissia japonica TaxID=1529436 RepID=UPI001425AB91|nr:uncharacterized protein LOC117113145 [Anneissia japonica]